MRRVFGSLATSLLFFLCVMSFRFFPVPAFAQGVVPVESVESTESALARSEPTFAADGTVTLSDTYPGPVFAVGGMLTFSGTTPEDLIVAGATVRVDGTVGQDLYAAGGSVVLSGTVHGNVVVTAGEVQILPSARIDGSVIAAGQRVRLLAPVPQEARFVGRNIFVSNQVGGNLQIVGKEVTLTETATVGGNLQVETEIRTLQDAASVSGTRSVTERIQPPKQKSSSFFGAFFYSFGSKVLLFALLTWLFPGVLRAGASAIRSHPGKSAVAGMVWLAAIPFAVLFLLFLVIGLPVALALAGLFLAAVTISWVFPVLAVGQKVLPRYSIWIQALGATFVFSLVEQIPIAGGVVQIVCAVLGTGALWLLIDDRRKSGSSSGKKA